MGTSLVQGSPTKCGVCLNEELHKGGPGPVGFRKMNHYRSYCIHMFITAHTAPKFLSVMFSHCCKFVRNSWELVRHFYYMSKFQVSNFKVIPWVQYTRWYTKCHTIDCTHNTFLLLQKHLSSGTELIPIGWKIFPNESL